MKYLFSFLALCCFLANVEAQSGAPKKFNYQAVPRLSDGTLIAAGTPVKVQFTLTEDGPITIKYGEEHIVNVSQHGVINAVVGGGSSSGILPFDFDALDWANHSYYMSVAVDLNSNGSFENSEKFTSSQLLSVPYALYAEKSGSGGTGNNQVYQWGNGIDIDSSTFTINNTGDTNPNDDLINTSVAGGDLNGTFSNLQINAGAIGSLEIQNGAIGAVDLGQMGASSNQVLKWNGATWAPANDETGGAGGGLTQVAVTAPLSGGGTPSSPINILNNSINSALIHDSTITLIDLAPGTIPVTLPPSGPASGDLSGSYQNPLVDGLQGFPVSAITPTQDFVLKWNGSSWAPAPDATGGVGMGDNWGTQSAVSSTPLTGNGTSGNPLTVASQSITGAHIQNGTIGTADLATGVLPTVSEGTGIDVTNSNGNYTVTNTAPDMPVNITGTGGTTVTGAYPNFNIHSTTGGGGLTGSGTTNYIPMFTGPQTLGNSIAMFNGNEGIKIEGNLNIGKGELLMQTPLNQKFGMVIRSDGKMAFEANGIGGDNTMVIDDNGDRSVNIGTDQPIAGFKFHVVGKAKFDTGVFFGSTEGFEDGGSAAINATGSINPKIHLGYSLGTAAKRWNTLNAGFANILNGVGIGGAPQTDVQLAITGGENDGTTAPVKIISGAQTMLLDGNEIDCTGGLFLHGNSTGNIAMVNGGGNVGIGTTAPTAKLSVNGTANKTGGGTWSTFSDRRLKENIAPYVAGIDVLEKIEPVTFHYNGKLGIDSKPEYVGIIAQEVQEVAPYMVSEAEISEGDEKGNTYLSFDPNAFTFMLINAAKTQQAEIRDLQATVAAQQKQIDLLLHEFEAMKTTANSRNGSSQK